MIIKIIEDLESDLREKAEENKDLLNQIIELFEEEDFIINSEINGTSFNKKEDLVNASFYVANDMSYNGYVTNDSRNSSNYTAKGNSKNVLKAAQQIIDIFNENLESEDASNG